MDATALTERVELKRLRAALPFGLAAACLTVSFLFARSFFHDDAFITLRYASRVLRGDGLSWTSGAPVEGYTHPLWLLQLIALGGLGIDLESAARGLGVTYAIALTALWLRARLWVAPLYMLLLHAGFALWMVSGLESTSFSFWCVLTFMLSRQGPDSTRHGARLGLVVAAAALTRPEGLGVAFIVTAWLAMHRRVRALAGMAAGFGLPFLAHLLFRRLYFGDFLPNTAYAKIGVFEPWSALLRATGLLWSQWETWLPFALTALAAGVAGGQRRLLLYSSALAAPTIASYLLAGGDHMQELRLLVPAFAVLAAGVGAARERAAHPHLLGHAVTLCIGMELGRLVHLAPTVQRDPAAEVGEAVGAYLEQSLPAGSTVALSTAGSTPYFAPNLEFIDMLGLTNAEIAHRTSVPLIARWQNQPGHGKGDGAYILSRSPDVIILGPAEGFDGRKPKAWFLSDYELATSAEFWRRYTPYALRVPPSRQPSSPYMQKLAARDGRFRLVAFLRIDSQAAQKLAHTGTALRVAPPKR
jgi:hypothetical protein